MKLAAALFLLLSCLLTCSKYGVQCNQLEERWESTNNTHLAELRRRQCVWNTTKNDYGCNLYMPTIHQLVARMRDPSYPWSAQPGALTFFYTNLVPLEKMMDHDYRTQLFGRLISWLRAQGLDDFIFKENALSSEPGSWFRTQMDWIRGGPDMFSFAARYGGTDSAVELVYNCYLQAIALATQNPDVILFTRHDSEPREDSYWNLIEFWPMTRTGGIVERILRVDIRRICRDNPIQTLWDRSRDPPRPPQWRCPLTEDDGSVPNIPDAWAPEPTTTTITKTTTTPTTTTTAAVATTPTTPTQKHTFVISTP
jgi:hypothetical protein